MTETDRVTHNSSWIEEAMEYQIVGGVCRVAWQRDNLITILRSQTDADGYDVLFEADNGTRHVQLKTRMLTASTRRLRVSTKLSLKPSGCVVLALYDLKSLEIDHFRWLGSEMGQPLPNLGDKISKHTKANAKGEKAQRPNHRDVPMSRFEPLSDFEALYEKLFAGLERLS